MAENNNNDLCNQDMQLNSQTKIGLTFGQIGFLVVTVFSFAMGYAALNSRITNLETSQKKFDSLQNEQMKMIYEIRENVVEIKAEVKK